jgi:aerobic C4-dicarboxylate transport protein
MARLRIFGQLWFLVVLGTLAGIAAGLAWPGAADDFKPWGDAFIALIRMLIGPVIFVTVVHGIAGMHDMQRVGRVAFKALLYFEAITILALIIGLTGVNLLQPGAGMHVDPHAIDAHAIRDYVHTAQVDSVSAHFLKLIPKTFASAFSEGDTLQVLLVSVLFGTALAASGDRGKPVTALIGTLSSIFFRIVHYVMWFAPFGAFGAIGFTVAKFGPDSLRSLGALIATLFLVCLVFVLVVLWPIARLAGIHFWRLIGFIRDELVLVLATGSSETVLPRLIEKLEKTGCEESVVGFVIPSGYSFNLDGTCLYLTSVAIFLAQATDTPMHLAQQLELLAVLLLTSKGAAGVSGAAFVVLAGTLGAVGSIPIASIALVLGIHRILGLAFVPTNVIGNCVATLVVARWEKAIDETRLAATIGLRRT